MPSDAVPFQWDSSPSVNRSARYHRIGMTRVADARPLVGVGVLVWKDDSVLLGLRRGSHGAGTWSPPGGHLEFGEEPIDCLRRETLEEAGIEIKEVEFVGITNDIFVEEGRHYVTLFYRAHLASGTPRVREPEKCDAWEWWPWEALPENLFLPLRHLREQT